MAPHEAIVLSGPYLESCIFKLRFLFSISILATASLPVQRLSDRGWGGGVDRKATQDSSHRPFIT